MRWPVAPEHPDVPWDRADQIQCCGSMRKPVLKIEVDSFHRIVLGNFQAQVVARRLQKPGIHSTWSKLQRPLGPLQPLVGKLGLRDLQLSTAAENAVGTGRRVA